MTTFFIILLIAFLIIAVINNVNLYSKLQYAKSDCKFSQDEINSYAFKLKYKNEYIEKLEKKIELLTARPYVVKESQQVYLHSLSTKENMKRFNPTDRKTRALSNLKTSLPEYLFEYVEKPKNIDEVEITATIKVLLPIQKNKIL